MDYRQNFKTALKEIFLLQKSQNREERPAEKQDIAAILALAALGAYVYVMNRGKGGRRRR